MESIYIDESGSMTASYYQRWPYFVICLIRAKNPDALKRVHKRFVSSRMDKLRSLDTSGETMFDGTKFKELKGSCLSPDMKRDFVHYFCRNDHFEVFYIVANNQKIAANKRGKLYENTARAFNYLLKLALEFYVRHGYLSNDGFTLQLDERNEKTKAKYFLENYLNTELYLNDVIEKTCTVQYYDSSQNRIIQIADVFANLKYSNLLTGSYEEELAFMKSNGYLVHTFEFPLSGN